MLEESLFPLMLAMHSLTKLKIEKGGCIDSVAVGGFVSSKIVVYR
jgi:hypothetical protein